MNKNKKSNNLNENDLENVAGGYGITVNEFGANFDFHTKEEMKAVNEAGFHEENGVWLNPSGEPATIDELSNCLNNYYADLWKNAQSQN